MRRLFVSVWAALAVAALTAAPADAFQFLAKWGTIGAGDGQLNQPFDLAVVPESGSQYVADHDNNRVVQFDANGGFVRSWGGLGAGDTQFNEPNGVGLDGQGNVWVADAGNNRIKKFGPAGNLLAVFGATGTGPGELTSPDDVAVDANGSFYVVEQGLDRVQRFTSAGAFVEAWPAANPTGVAIAGPNVYTTDYNGNTVERFDTEGNPLGTFGGGGSGAGQFNQPWHAGVDPAGNVYITDRANNRVQQLAADGTFIRAFGWGVASGAAAFELCTAICQAGSFGSGDGQFGAPGGVGADCRGNVYVVDQGFARVQKLGDPGTRNPRCPPNDFSFGKVKRNKRKGTAQLTVMVPGPGVLVLKGTGLRKQRPAAGVSSSEAVASAGKVKLLVKTKKGSKRRELDSRGAVKVKPAVTYTPTNGDPNTRSKGVKLIKLRR